MRRQYPCLSMASTFSELGVSPPIVEVLTRAHIREPFAVQSKTIPDLLAGRDVVGRAPTGSGKTLAFGIPMLMRVDRADPGRPAALVLAPTRELAAQIASDLAPIAYVVDRRILAVYGGVAIEPQIKKLKRGIDVLVATPGRLEDLILRDEASLAAVNIAVVDEADRMADMGFLPVVRRILDQTLPKRQTSLYSATLEGDVGRVVDEYQTDPVLHEVGSAAPDLESTQHHFWVLPRPERIPLCASVIATFGRTIVFTRTRHGADRAARQLARLGVKAVAIHGNRSQAQRTRALDEFMEGRAHALVATDVAARGIHVDAVECVVHFDPVDEDSAYLHRSGRTARAGARGHVVSFVDPGQVRLVKAMKRRLGLPQELTPPPETEDGPLPRAEPSKGDQGSRDARPPAPRPRPRPRNKAQGRAKKTAKKKGRKPKNRNRPSSKGRPKRADGSQNRRRPR